MISNAFLITILVFVEISILKDSPGSNSIIANNSFSENSIIVKNLQVLEKRKEILAEVTIWKDSKWKQNLVSWSYNKEGYNVLFDLTDDEEINILKVSQDEEYIIILTYTGYRSDPNSIIGCFNLLQKEWTWKFELNNIISDSYIRDINFIENKSEIVALSDKEAIFIDLESGKIVTKKKTNLDEYDYRGEVLELFTVISESGRYYVIWNNFSGGGLFPDWFYPKGNKYVSVWDIFKNREIIRIEKKPKEYWRIDIVNNDNNLIIYNNQKMILWSIKENRIVYEKELREEYLSHQFRIMKHGLIFMGKEGLYLLKYADIENSTKIDVIETIEMGDEMNMSSDGKLLALKRGYRLYLYDTENWQEIWQKDIRQ